MSDAIFLNNSFQRCWHPNVQSSLLTSGNQFKISSMVRLYLCIFLWFGLLVTKCSCRFHLLPIHSLFTINGLFSEPGWNLLGRGDSWAELELCWDLSRVGRPSCIGTCAICAKDKSPEMHRYCMILSRFVKGSRSQVILPGLLLFFHASFQRLQPCFCFFCLLFFLSCNHWGMPEPCRMCKLNWQPS